MAKYFDYKPEDLPSILERYYNNKMSPQDRYRLEKEALNDPLLESAMEGYINLTNPEESLNLLSPVVEEKISALFKPRKNIFRSGFFTLSIDDKFLQAFIVCLTIIITIFWIISEINPLSSLDNLSHTIKKTYSAGFFQLDANSRTKLYNDLHNITSNEHGFVKIRAINDMPFLEREFKSRVLPSKNVTSKPEQDTITIGKNHIIISPPHISSSHTPSDTFLIHSATEDAAFERELVFYTGPFQNRQADFCSADFENNYKKAISLKFGNATILDGKPMLSKYLASFIKENGEVYGGNVSGCCNGLSFSFNVNSIGDAINLQLLNWQSSPFTQIAGCLLIKEGFKWQQVNTNKRVVACFETLGGDEDILTTIKH